MVLVPPEVRERFAVRFGAGVAGWCDGLPGLVDGLAARWGLDVVGAGGGGTSRVFRCLRRDDGVCVWLKVTPDPGVAAEEAEALRAWAGAASVVGVLAQDLDAGALLLEGVEPGVPVRGRAWGLPEVAVLLRELRSPSPAPGRRSVVGSLARRVDFLFELAGRRAEAAGVGGTVGSAALERGREAALALTADGPVGLVHGDLHPANVLLGADGRLVAIDPRPAWGDPDFDAVDWVLEGVTERGRLERRAERLAALVPGQSAERVLGWCEALAVLLAVSGICAGQDDQRTRFLLDLAA